MDHRETEQEENMVSRMSNDLYITALDNSHHLQIFSILFFFLFFYRQTYPHTTQSRHPRFALWMPQLTNKKQVF